MIERQGNIWDTFGIKNAVVLVTTNNVINTKNELVMGAGIALEAKQRFPDFPKEIVGYYWVNPRLWNNGDYHLYINYTQQIGCIQTKRHWRDSSPIDLVQKSVEELNREARLPTNEHIIYNLPKPGCGLGGLDWETQVKPLCEMLPDNVVIWSKE